MFTFAIDCQGLFKSYGAVHSLRDCTFQVQQGQVFGLLGPNGAGKTTLLRTLLGFISPTAGKATVCGYDVCTQSREVRSVTAYLPGEPRLSKSLTGASILELFAGLHPQSDVTLAKGVAARLELDLSRRVMFMSTGMRQKLALSIVFGNRAPLVILDEPTANLDPNVRAAIVELISETRRSERTVVLSSHIFSDIDLTCDEVAILQAGTVVAHKSMSDVGSKHIVTGRLRADSVGGAEAVQRLKQILDAATCVSYWISESLDQASGEEFEIHIDDDPKLWLGWLADLELEGLKIERAGVRAFYQQVHHEQAAAQEEQTASAARGQQGSPLAYDQGEAIP